MNRIKDQIRCGAAYRLGLTGKGIGVAVLDTGIFLHRDFDSRVTGFADMVNGRTSPTMTVGMGPISAGSSAAADACPAGGTAGSRRAVTSSW